MDREYEVLEYISSSDEVTQREISEHLGISLGSVNLLLKKMIKEGFIKIEKIPANRVAYMLTPKGIQEKIVKTVSYIKIHYRAIEKHKNAVRLFLDSNESKYDLIYVFLKEEELKGVFLPIIKEYNQDKIIVLDKINQYNSGNNLYLVDDLETGEMLEKNDCNYKNLKKIF